MLIDYLKIITKEYGLNRIYVIPTPYNDSDIINPIHCTGEDLYKIYKKLGFKEIENRYGLYFYLF